MERRYGNLSYFCAVLHYIIYVYEEVDENSPRGWGTAGSMGSGDPGAIVEGYSEFKDRSECCDRSNRWTEDEYGQP